MRRVPLEKLAGVKLLRPDQRAEYLGQAHLKDEWEMMLRFEATIQSLAAELRYAAEQMESMRCLSTLRACGELDGPESPAYYNPLNE